MKKKKEILVCDYCGKELDDTCNEEPFVFI